MGRFKKAKNSGGGNSISDSVSELSHDESTVTYGGSTPSSAFRSKFFRGKNDSATPSNGNSASGTSNKSATPSSPGAVASSRSVGSAGTASSSVSKKTDSNRLAKDAKSRFNIGLIYLKTGDYAKAQDNLEHSLYCHMQQHGHDGREYTNDALSSIAGVREKLGECYLSNPDVVDKSLAMDHYEESRRLLGSVALEDAPDNIKEMLERVDEKLRQLYASMPQRPKPTFRRSNLSQMNQMAQKYQQEGNDKAKALLGLGGGGDRGRGRRGGRGSRHDRD